MSEKLSRKELKGPDAFQKLGAEARQWLQERQRLVVIAISVLLLGGAGAALASYFSDRGEERAAKDLGQVLKLLERPVVERKDEQALPVGEKDPPFKSEREKDEAIRKALAEFRETHKGTQAAATAALPQGHAALRLGEPDQALAAFKEYLDASPKDDIMRASALEGGGYALEAKGQLDQALEMFDRLARENTGDYLAGMGLYHQGRILALQGKKQEAAKMFAEVGGKFAGSAAARLAADRLALLAAEGVKPPPPPASAPDAG